MTVTLTAQDLADDIRLTINTADGAAASLSAAELVRLLRHLTDVRAELGALESEVKRRLMQAMGDEWAVETDGIRVERREPKLKPRWDSGALVGVLVRRAIDPDGTGEVEPGQMAMVQPVIDELIACAPFTASLGWRKTALKERGLYAGGKPTVLGVSDKGDEVLGDEAGFLTFELGPETVEIVSPT